MLEERTTVERWARSQIIRIEALRNSLKAMGRESYEEYLIPELLQPFYSFRGGWGGRTAACRASNKRLH